MEKDEIRGQLVGIAQLPLQEIARQLQSLSVNLKEEADKSITGSGDSEALFKALMSSSYMNGASFALAAAADVMFQVSDVISREVPA